MLIFKECLLLTVIFVYSDCVPIQKDSLELVQVFFRHGDRTPDKKDFYPTDPFKNYSFYPMGLGQLTNAGKQREYRLGQMLRKRYDDFLGDVFTPELLSATSTDFDRTKMSLMLVLAGMWPPSLIQQWDPQLAWQPIPFIYKKAAEDHLIQRPIHYCPRYKNELEKMISSEEVQQFIKDNKIVFEYVEKWTGKPMTKPLNMFDVYQNLNAEDSLGFQLPDWTKKIYPEPLHSIAGMQLKFENNNDLLIRLNGGHSLKLVLENMRRKAKHDKELHDKKVVLISGHENNIVNVLTTLDQFLPHVPVYGSAVFFELHRINNPQDYVVKVLHQDQKSNEPKVLKFNDCDDLCPLNKFIELTQRYVPGNYTAECQSDINLD